MYSLCPDRRDLGATEEQDEGSIGRSPNLSFEERESFFSNGQPFYIVMLFSS